MINLTGACVLKAKKIDSIKIMARSYSAEYTDYISADG